MKVNPKIKIKSVLVLSVFDKIVILVLKRFVRGYNVLICILEHIKDHPFLIKKYCFLEINVHIW